MRFEENIEKDCDFFWRYKLLRCANVFDKGTDLFREKLEKIQDYVPVKNENGEKLYECNII